MNPPPERIHNWQDSQLSIARFYGGINFTGCEAVRCDEWLELKDLNEKQMDTNNNQGCPMDTRPMEVRAGTPWALPNLCIARNACNSKDVWTRIKRHWRL